MDGCCIAAILAKAQGPWEQSCDDYSKEAAHLAAHVEVFPVTAVPAAPARHVAHTILLSPNDLPL